MNTIQKKIKHIIGNIGRSIKKTINHRLIKNKEISIISNNCWGGYMYQYANLQYNSPFVGLFFFADDYIKLLKNIDIIYKPFVFIEYNNSKYKDILSKKKYPIGLWPEYNIEIHFLHYKSEKECVEKWNRRLKRLSKTNLLVKFSDKDLCNDELIKSFDKLPFVNKICFTSKPFSDLKSVVWLKEQHKLSEVNYCWLISDKYWNFIENANMIAQMKTSFFHRLLLWISARIKIS